MVLDSWSSCPSSWCQASCASTRAVTRLLGMMGRPAGSLGKAMKSGRSFREGRDVPGVTVTVGRKLQLAVRATIWPCET